MDIYERLEQDHDRQRELMARLGETSGDSEERRELWKRLRAEAEAHANAEEQTLYACLLAVPEAQEQARHSITEHEETTRLIEELSDLDMSSPHWLPKFERLQHELLHHVDEEERDVFPQAKALIPAGKAEEMLERFENRKCAERP